MRSHSSSAAQQEGATPQGFETHWRRTCSRTRDQVPNQSGHMWVSAKPMTSIATSGHVRNRRDCHLTDKVCVFKRVVTTEYSRGANRESFGDATSGSRYLGFQQGSPVRYRRRRFSQCGDRGHGLDVQAGRMSRYRQNCEFRHPDRRGARDREQAARHRLHQEGLSGTASRPMNSFDAALDALREILAARVWPGGVPTIQCRRRSIDLLAFAFCHVSVPFKSWNCQT